MNTVEIKYQPGKSNANTDALSRFPHMYAPEEGLGEGEVQVSMVCSNIQEEQCRDPGLLEIFRFLEDEVLPDNNAQARKLSLQQDLYAVLDWTLYRLDPKQDHQKSSSSSTSVEEEDHGRNSPWTNVSSFFRTETLQYPSETMVVGRYVCRHTKVCP